MPFRAEFPKGFHGSSASYFVVVKATENGETQYKQVRVSASSVKQAGDKAIAGLKKRWPNASYSIEHAEQE